MNRLESRAAVGALALLLLATGLRAEDAPAPARSARARVRLAVDGGASFGRPLMRDERRYTEYAETAVVTTSEQVDAGYVTDVAAAVRVYRDLGVLVGWSFGTRGATGSFAAQAPHPLYLGQPRAVTGELSYDYRETALHTDAAYGRTRGRLAWSVFAGPSFFRLEPEMLDRVAYAETYPFDSPVPRAPSKTVSASATGFNVGGGVDYRLGRFMALGAQLRYARARAKLRATPDASETAFDAGGLQVGAGLRLYF